MMGFNKLIGMGALSTTSQALRLLFALLLTYSANTYALSFGSQDQFQLHGFASQGYVLSTENPYLSENTMSPGSLNFRELAANLNWNISSKLRLNTQVLSRTLGQIDDGSPKLDLLLLDYRAIESGNLELGARVGRVKTPYGFYNEIRDVPSARPGMFVPNSIYFEGLRDLMLATDGIDVYTTYYGFFGQWDVDLYGGQRSLSDKVLEYQYLGQDVANGDFKTLNKKGLKLMYSPDVVPGWTLGYSAMQMDSDMSISPALVYGSRQYSGVDTDILYQLVSIRWQGEYWQAKAEYMTGTTQYDIHVIGSGSSRYKLSPLGYYFQLGHQATDKLKGWLRYEHNEANTGTTSTSNIKSYYDSYSLVARYFFTPEWFVTADYSYNQGIAGLPVYTGYYQQATHKDWQDVNLQLTYSF